MKLLCDRERLREGLALVGGVIPNKSTRPAIENMLLVATDDALELVGTDLEVAVRYRIDDVKVGEPGTALVPSRVFTDFVRDLSGETVNLSMTSNHIEVSSGADRCELPISDPEEFPVVARFTDEGALSIQGGSFTRLVSRTSFAIAKEQGRYAMHGILTLIEDQVLRMVATDGRRLAVASTPIDSPASPPSKAILPAKGAQAFCRLVTDDLEQIELHIDENQMGIRTKRGEIFARLIDGEFPRYAAVIPTDPANRVEADGESLTRKIKLVSNVTTQDARAVKLVIKGQKLELTGRSTTSGQATSEMEVHFGGDEAEIAFNPDFLLEGIRHCETDMVALEFNDRTSPGKFTLGENYVYVVMPITVDV